MAVFGSNRPLAALTDTRILLMQELEREGLTQEQRVQILMKLADLQLLAKKKWRERSQKIRKSGKKAGRPRKLHDSQGQPLYNGVPPKDAPEPQDQKLKFLESLPSETATTE